MTTDSKHYVGVLIDPVAKTVAMVTVSTTKPLDDLYRMLDCTAVDFVYVDAPDGKRAALVVDDEGLLKENPKFFAWYCDRRGVRLPLAGKAVVMGLTVGEGDFTHSPYTEQEVANRVLWPATDTIRHMRDRGVFDTRIHAGDKTTVIPVRPKLEGDTK